MRMARNVAGIAVMGCVSLLAACGDPVPPAAQAGISIHIQEYDKSDPNFGGKSCPPYRHWINVPYDKDRQPGNQKQLTGPSDAVRAVNGQDGNKVSCSVKPAGSGFKVTGNGYAYAQDDMMTYNPSIIAISIPSISSGGSSSGLLTVQDHQSIVSYQSNQCTFSVQGDNLGVDAGKIWARVSCEGLTDDKSPDTACQVDTGFFVFENCAQ